MSLVIKNSSACRRNESERGAVLVEFALAAVVFLTLVYGSITYGVIFWVKASLTHAAGEGARAAIRATDLNHDGTVDATDQVAAASARAQQVITSTLPAASSGNATYTLGTATCTGSTDTCLTVTVQYPYKTKPIIPILPFLPAVPSQLTSASVIQLP